MIKCLTKNILQASGNMCYKYSYELQNFSILQKQDSMLQNSFSEESTLYF